MWGNAFNDDDPRSAELADEYGIVMGTSHHEPMMRAQRSGGATARARGTTSTTTPTLREFWRDGIAQHGHAREHRDRRHARRRRHADDARAATSRCSSGSSPTSARSSPKSRARTRRTTPQLWALYKEVQDYYDKGMRVPDDVTLLFATTTGATSAGCPTRGERSAPAATASTTTSTTSAARATTSGSTPTRSRASGSRCTWPTSMAPTASGS